MPDINFTSSAKKSIILSLFAVFLLSCISILMVGSTFHTASPPNVYLGLDNNGENPNARLNFISSLGYSVNLSSEEEEEIRIPMEFNDVYSSYNEIQKQSGTDLYNYRGACCVRYSYLCENNGDGEDLRINLIVYEGRIIGGDIGTVSLDGYMEPLSIKK